MPAPLIADDSHDVSDDESEDEIPDEDPASDRSQGASDRSPRSQGASDRDVKDAIDERFDDLTEGTERAAAEPQEETDDSEPIQQEQLADPVPDDGDESLFSGTDDVADEDEDESDSSGGTTASAPSLADSVNSGFARMAVIGLDEAQGKEELRGEFRATFEEFRLGFYGAQVCEEYLMAPDDDVDPVWGFAASALACTALVLYMRPDGEELIEQGRTKAAGFTAGLGLGES